MLSTGTLVEMLTSPFFSRLSTGTLVAMPRALWWRCPLKTTGTLVAKQLILQLKKQLSFSLKCGKANAEFTNVHKNFYFLLFKKKNRPTTNNLVDSFALMDRLQFDFSF